jgi:hypothetical protein
VTDVETVGHQQARRDRRHPEASAELGRRELGDLRRSRPADPTRLLPARLGRLVGVERVGGVQVGVLDRDLEDLDLEPVSRGGQLVGTLEEPAIRQVLDHHHIHMAIPAWATDSPHAQNPLSTRDPVTSRSRSLGTSPGGRASENRDRPQARHPPDPRDPPHRLHVFVVARLVVRRRGGAGVLPTTAGRNGLRGSGGRRRPRARCGAALVGDDPRQRCGIHDASDGQSRTLLSGPGARHIQVHRDQSVVRRGAGRVYGTGTRPAAVARHRSRTRALPVEVERLAAREQARLGLAPAVSTATPSRRVGPPREQARLGLARPFHRDSVASERPHSGLTIRLSSKCIGSV